MSSRILVVDDEAAIGRLVARILRSEFEVTWVASAAEALARLAEGERYQLILSDLMMPGMTGLDFYRHIESSHPELAERVAFMTGGSTSEAVEAFFERIKSRRILKPFDSVTLRAFVRSRLSP